MESDGRKHPAHLPAREQFNTPIIIFLTVCTKARKPILINGSAHQLMREVWQAQPSWVVGRYVIMPDHIHFFCAPADLIPQSLTKWVNFGNRMRRAIGYVPKIDQFGSATSGTRNCAEAKATIKNGIMCWRIQFVPALLNNLKIGHFKAR